MSTEVIKENKMGTMSVNKLLISMAVPMMISMLVQALYNVVDSIFVSYVSENALSALSMAFPIQNLMIAVGSGVGVGMNALLSKALGEKNPEKANRIGANGLFLAFCGCLLFVIFGLFFPRMFMLSQTDIGEIVESGTGYLQICCTFSLGLFGQMTFERLLQSTGKTQLSMVAQLSGALTNIVLDPIMIFGLLGFPKMGVKGAAIATVVGQFVAFGIGFLLNRNRNKEIHITLKKFRPVGALIRGILIIGVPSILMVAIGSVMTYSMNRILIGFTSTAVAVFGVYFKLQSFVFMPVFGLNNGMIPILSYNYGARRRDRMNRVIKLGVIYAVSIMLIGLAIFQLMPDKLLALFDASPEMLKVGVPAMRTISLSFIFAGYSVVSSSVCQALGKSIYSLFVSIGRQLIILIPSAYLLSLAGRLAVIWWAFPIAEIMSLVLCTIFLIRTLKRLPW